jgi:hypothetical protein
MAKTLLQTIRNGVMVIGVCASLAAGSLGFSGSAEARVPEGDRVGDSAMVCGLYQDIYDDYKRQRDNAKTKAERDRAQASMDAYATEWIRYGCQDWYGGIGRLVVVHGAIKNQAAVEPSNTAEVSPISRQLAGAATGGMFFASGQ